MLYNHDWVLRNYYNPLYKLRNQSNQSYQSFESFTYPKRYNDYISYPRRYNDDLTAFDEYTFYDDGVDCYRDCIRPFFAIFYFTILLLVIA